MGKYGMATDGRSGVEVECSRRGWGRCARLVGLGHVFSGRCCNAASRCCQQQREPEPTGPWRAGGGLSQNQGKLVSCVAGLHLVGISVVYTEVNTPVEGGSVETGPPGRGVSPLQPKWGMRGREERTTRQGFLVPSVIHFQTPVRKTRTGGNFTC